MGKLKERLNMVIDNKHRLPLWDKEETYEFLKQIKLVKSSHMFPYTEEQWQKILNHAKTNLLLAKMIFMNDDVPEKYVMELCKKTHDPHLSICILKRENLSRELYEEALKKSEYMVMNSFMKLDELTFKKDIKNKEYEKYNPFSQKVLQYMIEDILNKKEIKYNLFPFLFYNGSDDNIMKEVLQIETNKNIIENVNVEYLLRLIAKNTNLHKDIRNEAFDYCETIDFDYGNDVTEYMKTKLYQIAVETYFSNENTVSLTMKVYAKNLLIEMLVNNNISVSNQRDLYYHLRDSAESEEELFKSLIVNTKDMDLLKEIYKNDNIDLKIMYKNAEFKLTTDAHTEILKHINNIKRTTDIKEKHYSEMQLFYIINKEYKTSEDIKQILSLNSPLLTYGLYATFSTFDTTNEMKKDVKNLIDFINEISINFHNLDTSYVFWKITEMLINRFVIENHILPLSIDMSCNLNIFLKNELNNKNNINIKGNVTRKDVNDINTIYKKLKPNKLLMNRKIGKFKVKDLLEYVKTEIENEYNRKCIFIELNYLNTNQKSETVDIKKPLYKRKNKEFLSSQSVVDYEMNLKEFANSNLNMTEVEKMIREKDVSFVVLMEMRDELMNQIYSLYANDNIELFLTCLNKADELYEVLNDIIKEKTKEERKIDEKNLEK